jgi:hypothetical protein
MSSGRLLWIVYMAWLCVACARAPRTAVAGAEQRLHAEVASIEFGMPFALEARRAWDASLEPSAWSEPTAPGLRLEPLNVERRDAGPAPYELRRYRARALTLAPELHIVLPAWQAIARDGKESALAAEQRLTLQIHRAVDHAQPGPLDLPQDLELPRGVPGWLLAVGGAAATWIAWRLVAARRPAPAAPSPPAESSDARASIRARLRALTRRSIPDRAAERAFHDEAADIVRAWLAAQGVAGVAASTREELLAEWGTRPGGIQLDAALAACELVQFARARSDEASRAQLLAALAHALGEVA